MGPLATCFREYDMSEEAFDLNSLNDQELTEQVHDDLYNGLKEEVEEATHIFLSRGWSAEKVLNDALVEGMRIVGDHEGTFDWGKVIDQNFLPEAKRVQF